jgi:hypothetical protein
MKRTGATRVNTFWLFARDWPAWISVETDFDLDLEGVCLKESTCVANLAPLYSKVTFITWEI